jgi:predicted carbohydrate-binding protein with CBM5 and CBM33 domain
MYRKRTMVALTVSAAILASGAVTVLASQPAFAHGAMQSPASRLYACYVDGLTSTGEIKPKNPACAAAVAAGGTQPLYDWYGDNRFDGAGQTVGYIPDGSICSGGNAKYAAYDTPSVDWPVTNVTPGANFNFVYGAWVPHPGAFKLYVTKDGFDPTKTLTWADMESTPFLTADPEPAVVDQAYRFSGKLPSNKTGRHIIYSVWYRSDSKETFYNCSDVNFGGSGGGTTPSPSPSPSASPSKSPSAAPSGSVSLTGTPSMSDPVHSPSQPTGRCGATATVVSSWSSGFQSDVTIKNTGTTAMTAWYVSFTVPTGVAVGQGWNATFTQSGTTVMVRPVAWNSYLAPGATASVGFLGTGNSGTPTISGVACG